MRWLVALCLFVSVGCEARPYSIDDLLAQESYGQVILAAKARLVLVERRGRYDGAADYSFGYQVRRLLSKVMVTNLRSPGQLSPLFSQADGAGYWTGTLSPSGRQLSVFRLAHRHVSLGVVDLGSRQVRWYAATPDLPLASPSPVWLDDDHLIVSTIEDGSLPFILSLGNANQTELTELWSRAADGRARSSTFVGSSKAEPDRAVRSLIELDLQSGKTRPLYRGIIVDLTLSPDRRHLAIMSAAGFRQPTLAPIDTAFIGRLHNLRLLDLSNGQVVSAEGDYLPGFVKWSPDGRQLLAFRARGTFQNGEYVRVNTLGKTVPLSGHGSARVDHDQSGTIVHAGWIGSNVIAAVQNGPPTWVRLGDNARSSTISGAAELAGSDAMGMWFRIGSKLSRYDERGLHTVVAGIVADVGTTSLDPYSLGYRKVFDPPAAGRRAGTLGGTADWQARPGCNGWSLRPSRFESGSRAEVGRRRSSAPARGHCGRTRVRTSRWTKLLPSPAGSTMDGPVGSRPSAARSGISDCWPA